MATPLTKPTTMLQPFARAGSKNTIPDQPDATPGHASMQLGFPPLTMTRIEEGGKPPSGLDFNGILNFITQHVAWMNGGNQYTFDAALAAYIGGYPVGAVLQSNDGQSSYVNAVAGNTTDFNTMPASIGVSWIPFAGKAAGNGVTTMTTTGGTTTLTAAQYNAGTIVVSGALTSNATLVMPAQYRRWTIVNNTTGPFSVTAKTASGTGVLVGQGRTDTVVGDGTNIDYELSSGVTAPTNANDERLATTAFVQTGISNFGANSIPQYRNANFTAGTTGDYWTDTSGGAFTMALPDPPVNANPIRVQDIAGTWSINNLTINAGSKTILGSSSPLVCDVNGEFFELWYNGSDWRLV